MKKQQKKQKRNKRQGHHSGSSRARSATGTAVVEQPPQPEFRHLLESEVRLSECMLWRLLEEYYDQSGISAWDQTPFYHTSNPIICETYADMIIAFLQDYKDHLNPDEPVYIVEMATGTGCFSFYLLRNLVAKMPYFEHIRNLKLRYVMTDFTENNVRFWEQNELLKPFCESGMLDFAIFKPEEQETMVLRRTGAVLSSETTKNPVIAIANYFFDSIRQELFRVDSGKLLEGRVTLERKSTEEIPPDTPIRFEEIVKTESFRDMEENYYMNPELNDILRYYREHYERASVLFPIGAFNVIYSLKTLSNNNLVLLSSDKGFTTDDYVAEHWDQGFALHGSFSFMVNYQAIRLFFEGQGGRTFYTTDRSVPLATTMNTLLAQPCALEHSHYYFQETVSKRNPINFLVGCQDFLLLQPQTDSHATLKNYVAYMRLCNYDPMVLYLCGEYLHAALAETTPVEREELIQVLRKMRGNLCGVKRAYHANAYYWMGFIHYCLDEFDDCLEVFHASLDAYGPDYHAYYYIAACNEVKQRYADALHYYQQALELDPGCELTQEAIRRMNEHLASAVQTS